MQTINVTVEAEMVVRRSLAQLRLPQAASPGSIERIELFVHALNPLHVIFGTAEVDGHVTALPDDVIGALSALYARNASALKPALRPKYL